MGRYPAVLVVMMWALVLLGGAFRPGGQAAGVGAQAGQLAPALQGSTLDGQPIALADLKGKAVFVNFWASWCGPCRLEMPEVQRLAADLPPGAAVLTVNTEASPEVVRQFLQEHGYDFPVLQDPSERAAIDFQVLSLPTSLFISPSGVIRTRINGPLTYGAMVDYLQAAGR